MASSMEGAEGFDDTTMEMLSANLPSNAFTTHAPDPRLERARQEMERTQQITPLLKEELRLRILTKRLQKGEPEIEINSGEPISYELTEEEKAKRERRRAQNRRAAKKCRQKRKMKSLSDAEKFRLIREENQQLRNEVTYLRYKEEIYANFCKENILPSLSPDVSSRSKLLALLRSRGRSDDQAKTTTKSSTSGPVSESIQHNCEVGQLILGPQNLYNNYPGQSQATPVLLPTTSAQCVLRVEQSIHSMEELKELPVHEITSFLPTEPDFIVSDHSPESTPPELSPTSFFSTMSPNSEVPSSGISGAYFSHMTPSTSYSGNNTSSFSSSNDNLFASSSSDLQRALVLASGASTNDLSQDMFIEHLHSEIPPGERILRKVSTSCALGEVCATTCFTSQSQGEIGPHKQSIQGSYTAHPDLYKLNEEDVFAVAASSNVNTAFLGEYPSQLGYLLNGYIPVEQSHTVANGFNGCHENPVVPTIPISPLTPLSPPSPNVTFSPLSPVSLSTDMLLNDCSTSVFVNSSSGAAQCQSTVTPARPIVRRTSSTTSIPSPYVNHYLSISLSPPPSVPSPTSNGIPESPSILALPPGSDDNYYHPLFSPVSTSTDHSPGLFIEMSEEEFD